MPTVYLLSLKEILNKELVRNSTCMLLCSKLHEPTGSRELLCSALTDFGETASALPAHAVRQALTHGCSLTQNCFSASTMEFFFLST